MNDSEDLDLHLTRLVGWAVNLLGLALLVGIMAGLLAALVFGLAGAGAGALAPAGVAVSMLVFAVVLWLSSAPFPIERQRAAEE